MAAAPHFGIRYEGDLTGRYSEYVIDSVDLLNAQLAHRDLSFFFDTVDVHQQIIDGKHCEDMYGWIVSNELIEEFEPTWLARKDGELEGYDYVCATMGTRLADPMRENIEDLTEAVVDTVLRGVPGYRA